MTSSTVRGFTLIELLVVISIIALLIAILLPSLSAARERSRQVICASNLRGINTAYLLYDYDHRTFPSSRYNVANGVVNSLHIVLRDDYGLATDIAYCPSGGRPNTTAHHWNNNGTVAGMGYWNINGWATHPNGAVDSNAYPNGWVWSTYPHRSVGFFAAMSASYVNHTQFPPIQPSQQFLHMDLAYRQMSTVPHTYLPRAASHDTDGDGQSTGANTSFLDGHVEWGSLQSGVSWRIIGNAGSWDIGFWSPRSIEAPAGAVFMP